MNVLANRRRRTVVFVGIGITIVASAAIVLLLQTRDKDNYVPGQKIEGLTTDLARELPEDRPPLQFTEVSKEAGIEFVHFPGTRTSQLPEDMGSGLAWGDYDGDGWLDLVVVDVAGPLGKDAQLVADPKGRTRLFQNRGDGTFRDVTTESGIHHQSVGMAAAWADPDADGDLDLTLTAYGGIIHYRNNGDGTFADASIETGLGRTSGFFTGMAWADYDKDGDLDLYVCGYVDYKELPGQDQSIYDTEEPPSTNPSSFRPSANLLFRNDGTGVFSEVGQQSAVAGDKGRSLEAIWSDLDGDGWLDLYVANDVSDNVLYRNLGNGSFMDLSHPARVADYRGAMGMAVGDWDGDQDQDLFVTHWIAQENALYVNKGPLNESSMTFMDEADRYGLGQIALDYIGWGTSFQDFDNDGRLDLFVVNGSTFQVRDDPRRLVPMRDQVFWNGGSERGFFDLSPVSGDALALEAVGRGAAFADYDNDGDVDIAITNINTGIHLLRNDSPARTGEMNWLQLALVGRQSNREGIGAIIEVQAGDAIQMREVGVQASYLSQDMRITHLGLGATTVVDRITVRWPSGITDELDQVATNRRITIEEGERSVGKEVVDP